MLRPLQAYLPAALHRIRRCSAADVAAITQLLELIEGAFLQPRVAPSSQLLGANIGMSELYSAPTDAQLAEIDEWLLVVSDIERGAEFFATWPRYERDEHYATLTNTAVPALMLQGNFDPQTPPRVATNLRDRLTGPNQTYVEVPFSAHNVVQSSQVTDANETCGQQLLRQFLADPTAELDTRCTTATFGPNFVGIEQNNQTLFGTADMWD